MNHALRRSALALTLALALVLAAPAAQAQVDPTWDTGEWIGPDTTIGLQIVAPPAGRLAIFLGATDVTDLFRRRGSRLVYRPELLPLPRGASELVVWEARAAGWRELGRFPVRVLRRGGLEAADVELRLDVEGLLDVDTGGSEPPPEDERLTAQIDLRQSAAKGGWSLRAGANVVGVSQIEQALRFGDEGGEADRFDLSRWSLALSRDRLEIGLGHLSWGDNRHLIQGFSSRGARVKAPIGRAVDVSFAAMNGTSIVGWDNLLGLSRSEHQVRAGTLGVELRPARPGALRFEVTVLDGSLQPESGFNQGDVNDREENDGWSLRLLAHPSDRLRLDAAFSESEYTNPFDPLLAQGGDLVPVRAETRNARYLDLGWSLLRTQTADDRFLELALELDHRRVEPLYRSVASFVQADVEENEGRLRLVWGGLSALLSHSDGRDNLDDLPSVLTTDTDRTAWGFVVPLAELSRAESPSPWLPALTLSGDRTHQAGEGVPVDGGFSPGHVPDQVSTSHQAGLRWTGSRWSLSADASLSDQDNRQPGREDADFRHGALGISLSTSPSNRLDLGLDLRREREDNEELGEETTTDVLGLRWNLRLPARHLFTGNLSWTDSATDPGVRTSENLVGDAQWSWAFERRRRERGVSGRLYLRGAYQESEAVDLLFGFADHRDGWEITSGLNLSVH